MKELLYFTRKIEMKELLYFTRKTEMTMYYKSKKKLEKFY